MIAPPRHRTVFAILLMLGVAQASANETPSRASLKNGQMLYDRCVGCHSLARDRTGPRHCGLFGRKAGSIDGFQYSDAMKRSNIVWRENTLDAFLRNPFQAMPGTSMGYAGIADPDERRDLIAYLREANQSDECTKSAR